MKIAIPYENGQVFQHFGHSAQFKLYTAEEGRITGAEVVSTDGQGHGALVGFLVRSGVNVLLCGGIGGGAQMALAQAGIRLYGGITGNADSAAAAYLAGTLVFDPNARWSLTPTPAAPTTITKRATAAALTPATPTRAAAPAAATEQYFFMAQPDLRVRLCSFYVQHTKNIS